MLFPRVVVSNFLSPCFGFRRVVRYWLGKVTKKTFWLVGQKEKKENHLRANQSIDNTVTQNVDCEAGRYDGSASHRHHREDAHAHTGTGRFSASVCGRSRHDPAA